MLDYLRDSRTPYLLELARIEMHEDDVSIELAGLLERVTLKAMPYIDNKGIFRVKYEMTIKDLPTEDVDAVIETLCEQIRQRSVTKIRTRANRKT